jgi:S-formylglutathione hydrolase FrmB
MYDYILRELPDVVMDHFPVTSRKSISGHSMGGWVLWFWLCEILVNM